MQTTISPTRKRYPTEPYMDEERQQPIQRSLADFTVIFLILMLLFLVTGSIGWQFWHVNRIFNGVTVANVAVGGMTRAQALQTLRREITHYPAPALSVTHGDQQWPIPATALQGAPDLQTAVNQAYLIGRRNPLPTRLGQQLVALLGGINIHPPLRYDQNQIQQAILGIANEVQQPGQAARQIGNVTLPAQPSVVVDVAATTDTLWNALQAERVASLLSLPLIVTESSPPAATQGTGAETATAVVTRRPLRLVDNRYGIQFAIDPILLRDMRIGTAGDTTAGQLDETAAREYLAAIAAQINVAPRDARLRFNAATGGITVIQESYPGRQLDLDATIAALRDALAKDVPQAALVISPLPPAVDMNRVAEMGIRELVASGTSYFRGSSTERVHNIVVAAEKFDGLVIPPGEIFSFNDGVEDVTSANGFEDSLVIMGDTTAVGVGGGVCQVSTTVFRAAYSGGFEIVERYNHGYVVSWYGEPGLDATIYTPTVDFRFRNDTNAYLLIEPVVDTVSGVITFNFYGTKPAREVRVGVPQRSDVKEPEEPAYVINEDLAAGQIVQKEWEQKGMTVSVERTIVENGTTRTDTLTSVYLPWQAKYEMGPGTQIELTPTPTPAQVEGALDPNIAVTPTPSSPESGP
ncbi:MAG: VanW family protein [Caldilineaceae bacterium]|nr:VanW family protein [Caldilineaceae bacterium]